MDSTIKVLRFAGFWSRPNRTYYPIQAVAFISAVMIWILIPELLFIVRQEPSFSTIIKNLGEILITGMAIPQATIFLMHRDLLEQTYGELQANLDYVSNNSHNEVHKVLLSLKKFSSWILKGYFGGEALLAGPYFISVPTTVILKYCITGTLPSLRGVFDTDYFIFNYHSNVWVWFITIVITICIMTYVVIFLVSSHCFYWSLLNNISGLFKIVCIKMDQLDEISDDSERRAELTKIIILHEVGYRSSRAMEKSLNVFMLILYGMCIFNLCMTMVVLSLPTSDHDLFLKMVFLLIYLLFHIFVYSMLGTRLMTTSEKTARAFYATSWYMTPIDEQRIILFALVRSQTMAALTAGKYVDVSRATFGKTLQSAVSYFTVMRQVYGTD